MNQLIPICLVAAAAFAQEPEANSFRGMVRLNRAPVSNEVLQVKLPRPVERRLANGIRLVVLETNRTPTISLSISIPSSRLRDPESLPGVAEATAAMMMMGTASKTQRQISEALADLGSTIARTFQISRIIVADNRLIRFGHLCKPDLRDETCRRCLRIGS